jgi:hypothetical protein
MIFKYIVKIYFYEGNNKKNGILEAKVWAI